MLGVDDLVVVTTPDAVLVLPAQPRRRGEEHRRRPRSARCPRSHAPLSVYRPWGHSEGVDQGQRFQVERIVVTPGGTLSLPKHMHRAEHWVVVHGTAAVTIGEEQRTVHENKSTYVPMGAVHRLADPGRIPLELVEVQPGHTWAKTTSCGSKTSTAARQVQPRLNKAAPAPIFPRRLLGDRPAGLVFTDPTHQSVWRQARG